MTRLIVCVLCVVAAASQAGAELKPADIGGRWQGDSYTREMGGKLTLDIVACGAGWCGIKIGDDNTCGGTALKVDGGALEGDYLAYTGTLELAPGTDPYTVHASIFAPTDGTPTSMQITGDTGGVFRVYRRSFPFEAQLARSGDPVCHAPQTVSSAD